MFFFLCFICEVHFPKIKTHTHTPCILCTVEVCGTCLAWNVWVTEFVYGSASHKSLLLSQDAGPPERGNNKEETYRVFILIWLKIIFKYSDKRKMNATFLLLQLQTDATPKAAPVYDPSSRKIVPISPWSHYLWHIRSGVLRMKSFCWIPRNGYWSAWSLEEEVYFSIGIPVAAAIICAVCISFACT